MKANAKMIAYEINCLIMNELCGSVDKLVNEIQKINNMRDDFKTIWFEIQHSERKDRVYEGIFAELLKTWKQDVDAKMEKLYASIDSDVKYLDELIKEYQILTRQINTDEKNKDFPKPYK